MRRFVLPVTERISTGKARRQWALIRPRRISVDSGTIAQLQESYLFWRIKKGGVGLPVEGNAVEISHAAMGSGIAGRMDLENYHG